MTIQPIEVLSDAVNAAVVRMPGRRYPGLVVQSDKLVYLSAMANKVAELAAKSSDPELARRATNLTYEIDELMARYREGCQ
jgi:hypothetical protein